MLFTKSSSCNKNQIVFPFLSKERWLHHLIKVKWHFLLTIRRRAAQELQFAICRKWGLSSIFFSSQNVKNFRPYFHLAFLIEKKVSERKVCHSDQPRFGVYWKKWSITLPIYSLSSKVIEVRIPAGTFIAAYLQSRNLGRMKKKKRSLKLSAFCTTCELFVKPPRNHWPTSRAFLRKST